MEVSKEVSFQPSLWTFLVSSKKPAPPVVQQMFCQKKKEKGGKLWKKIEKWLEFEKQSPCKRKLQTGHCEMKRQQVFFMYYAKWKAEPSTWTWKHPVLPWAYCPSSYSCAWKSPRVIHWVLVIFINTSHLTCKCIRGSPWYKHPRNMLSKYTLKVKLHWHFMITHKSL